MKVAAVVPLYPPHSLVGAWLATHAQLAHLTTRGHQVTVWAYLARTDQWRASGVDVHGSSLGADGAVRAMADADVVVGHCGDAGQAAAVARRAGRPLVQFFHGGGRPPDEDAALVIFNSEASRDLIGWSGPSIIAHPYTDPATHRAKPGDRVTLVNCSVEKGGALFQNLARTLPHCSFLAVQGGHGDQVRMRGANIDQIAPTAAMAGDVWSRTRILCVPSRREAWGMVGVEALASGIPVVASDLPGLRESLGDAAVFLPPRDHVAWAREVDRLHDPHEWQVASKAALGRSSELAAIDPRPIFADALEAVCSS